MSRLVRLYPPAWRDRYLAEFDELLGDHPPTVGDRLDILRGALDAWIHPQVVAVPRHEGTDEAGTRRVAAGAAAAIGGGLWIAGGLAMNATRLDQSLGYKDSILSWILLVAAALATALGAVALARSTSGRSTAPSRAAVVMLVGAILMATPYPFLAFGFYTYAVATAVFGLLLVTPHPRPLGSLLAISALAAVMVNTEDERALLTIPIGLAWIAVGSFALRRAPAVTAA